MGGHAGSGDHTGNPELSENRVSQGRPSGALSHDHFLFVSRRTVANGFIDSDASRIADDDDSALSNSYS